MSYTFIYIHINLLITISCLLLCVCNSFGNQNRSIVWLHARLPFTQRRPIAAIIFDVFDVFEKEQRATEQLAKQASDANGSAGSKADGECGKSEGGTRQSNKKLETGVLLYAVGPNIIAKRGTRTTASGTSQCEANGRSSAIQDTHNCNADTFLPGNCIFECARAVVCNASGVLNVHLS